MQEMSLRQKSVLDLIRRVKPLKKTIKQWFYHAGMKFLQGRQLTDEQEVLNNSHCYFKTFALYKSKYITIDGIDSEHELEIYDENGNMVKTDEVYGSGSPYTTVYSYDEFGRLISSHNTNVTYQYFYDAAGNLVREELVNYEGKTTVNTYEYDSQGRLIKESRDNSSREYIYDENGNLCKKTNISEVGTARLETVFDANGRPKKRTNVNYNGDYFTYRFKYDKYGCMTYCSFGGNSFDKREYKLEYKLVYIPYDEIPSEALRVINILDAFV